MRTLYGLLSLRRWLAIVSMSLFALTLTASATLAAGGHAFSTKFGAEGPASGDFQDPTSVAVNEATGDVYVSDTGNDRLEYFTTTGGYIGEFNGAGALLSPGEIAIDNSTNPLDPSVGDVYVIDTGRDVIDKFSAKGKFEGELHETGGQEGGLAGIAVDPTGNLWTYTHGGEGKSEGQAVEFNDEATYVVGSSFNTEKGVLPGLAVDASDHLYIITGSAFARRITPIEPVGTQVTNEEFVSGVAMDELTGDLYVDKINGGGSPAKIEHYALNGRGEVIEPGGDTCAFTSLTGCPPSDTFGSEEKEGGELSGAEGLAVNGSDGLVYVANSGHNDIVIYEAHDPPEAPHTEAATPVGAKTASLHGELNPGGAPGELEYRFDYNLGSSCATGGAAAEYIAEAKHAVVEANATGLEPASQYTYCLVAINPFGSTPSSNQESFNTESEAPAVTSEGASAISQTGATIVGQVNPNNEAVKWHIEYSTGPTLAGATDVPSPDGTISSGYGDVAVSEPVGSLTPNTTYYYRIVASNTGGGTRQGTIQSFVTLPSTPATEPASQIHDEEVTLNGSFNPEGQDTHYYFEYGTTACTPSACEHQTNEENAVATSGEVSKSSNLIMLAPLTIYYYRIVVANATGVSRGREREVTTLALPPLAEADPPANVRSNGAMLTGSVDPQGVVANYYFEYGNTTAYGSTLPEDSLPASSSGELVSANIAGLAPSTTYHYRLVAVNNDGQTTIDSADQTFTTYSSGEPESGALPSGFSLTGAALAGSPASSFPNLTGVTPLRPARTPTTTKVKPLTRVQRLAKALHGCRLEKGKVKRARCERLARATHRRRADTTA